MATPTRFIGLFLLTLLSGCGEPSEAQKPGLVVINVLDKQLYDDCHIKGSINMPFEMLDQQAERLDKNTELVIYCSNYQCTSSEYVAKKLGEKGFCKIAVYEAGMAEWFQKGLPVEGPCTKSYLSKVSKPVPYDEGSIAIISTQELAEKMGILSKDEKRAA